MCLNSSYTNLVEVSLRSVLKLLLSLPKSTPPLIVELVELFATYLNSTSLTYKIQSLPSSLAHSPASTNYRMRTETGSSPLSRVGPRKTITMCANCSRVRRPRTETDGNRFASSIRTSDDEVQLFTWIPLAEFLGGHSENLKFSHGICSDCYHKESLELDSTISSFMNSSISLSTSSSGSPKSPLAFTSRSHSPSQRALVVDDNSLQCKILKKMVVRAGFECDTAANGHEAIDFIQKNEYSLVLMDLLMGETDGWSTTVQIRKLEESKRQRNGSVDGASAENNEGLKPLMIVAVTGLELSEELQSKCKQAGMDVVLSKPLSDTTVRGLLEKSMYRDNDKLIV